MTFKIESAISKNEISEFLKSVSRDQLEYGDYRTIDDPRIHAYNLNRISESSKDDYYIKSYDETNLNGVLKLQYLGFDSEYLNLKCFRIADILITENSESKSVLANLLQGLGNLIKERHIQYLVYALNMNNSNNSLLLMGLFDTGFYYINTLITFSIMKGDYKKINHAQNKSQELIIRESKSTDRDRLMTIAQSSFKIDRLHLDPNLDKKKCDRIYSTSVENSLLKGMADIIFVSEIHDIVVGYYSGKKHYIPELDLTMGNAIISAVDAEYRKYGAFSQMNEQLLAWFSENTDISEMGTYINNIPIHRTWTNNSLNITRGVHQIARFIK
jgi:hypothetical protein